MATKTVMTCDMCGKEPAATVTVSAADRRGDVDLCERHTRALAAAVEPFINAGRQSARPGRSRTTRPVAAKAAAKKPVAKKAATKKKKKAAARKPVGKKAAAKSATTAPTRRSRRGSNVAAIRNWGWENGFEVATRGRLKPDLVAAYTTATRTANTAK